MSPGGNSYKISIPISVVGDAQLQRALAAITSLRSEVTQLGPPMRTLAADSAALAASMTAIATGSKNAARGIQSLITQLNNYVKVAQQAQNIPAVAPGSGLTPGGGGGGGRIGGGGGRDIGGYFGRIGGRIGGYFSGIPGGGFIGSQGVGALGIGGAAGYALGGVAVAGLAAYELVKNANETAKYAQEQSNLAKELGTTAQFTQLLGRVSQVTGVQTNGLYEVLKSLNKEVTAGGTESRKTKEALADLGLTTAVAFEKPEAQINTVLGALRKIGDETERERLAVNLFGDAGRQLLPLVDSFDKVSQAVKNTGVILDGEGRKKLEDYAVATGILKLKWDALAGSIAQATVAVLGFNNAVPTQDDVDYSAAHSGARRAPRRLLPASIPTDGGVAAGQALEESIRARGREIQVNDVEGRVLGAPERAKKALDEATAATGTAREKLLSGRASREDYESALSAQERAKDVLEAANRAKAELQEQQRKLKELSSKTFTFSETGGVLRGLPTELSRLTGTPGYAALSRRLQSVAGPYTSATEGERNPDERFLRRLQEQAAREQERNPDAILPGFVNPEQTPEARARARADQFRGRAAEGIYRNDIADVTGNFGIVEAQAGRSNAVRQGLIQSQRYGNPIQYGRAQLGEELTSTSESYKYRIDAASAQSQAALNAASKQPFGSAESANLLAEADKKNLEVKQLLIDAETKQIDSINKFNTSIDEAAKNVRDQISGGFTSLILAAQQPGGRALRPAARSFLEGQESTILHNTTDTALQAAGFAHGNPLGVSGPLANILKGTILGQVDNKKDLALNSNTAALLALTSVITGRPVSIAGGAALPQVTGAGGGGDISAVGGVSTPSGINPALLIPGAQAVTQALAGGGLSASSALSSSAGLLSAFAKGTGGNFASGAASNLNGYGLSVALDPGFNTATRLGAGLGFAGQIAGGAAVIDRGLTKGGLGGDLTAAGGAVGIATTAASSVAKLLGATLPSFIPIVGSLVAAVLPLIGGLFGSNPQKRQNQITSELSTNQYIAPQALNITESSNGTLGSFDARGNYRTTNLSAYPTVSQGSVYTQTHGLFGGPPTYYTIPGRTITPYSGNATGTGAAPVAGGPAATNITINAMDAESMTQFLVKNHPAVGAALTAHLYSGDTSTHSAIKFAVPGAR